MMYKNSIKLWFSNFSLVWRLLVYFVIVYGISFGISSISAVPIYNELKSGGFFDLLSNTYSNFVLNLNLAELTININLLTQNLLDIILSNISSITTFIVLFMISVFIIKSILRGFYMMACCNSLYYFMTSNAKQSFITSMAENFSKNVIYQFYYLITILPIKLLIYFGVFMAFRLCYLGPIGVLFAPIVAICIYTFLSALRISLFAGWIPSVVAQKVSVSNGLIEGFKAIKRRFANVYSNSIGIVLTIIFANVFVGVFTFGVAWIITIPGSFLLTAIFNMTTYFTCSGIRFYVDPYNVIAPKRKEQTENLTSQKFII